MNAPVERVARFVCQTPGGGFVFATCGAAGEPCAEIIGDGEGRTIEDLVAFALERYGEAALSASIGGVAERGAESIGFTDGASGLPFAPRPFRIVADRATTAEESHAYFWGYALGSRTRWSRLKGIRDMTTTTTNETKGGPQ